MDARVALSVKEVDLCRKSRGSVPLSEILGVTRFSNHSEDLLKPLPGPEP